MVIIENIDKTRYNYSKGQVTDKYEDDFNSDKFSESGKRFVKGASNIKDVDYRSYLGTPSGEFKVYIPKSSGEVEYVIVK